MPETPTRVFLVPFDHRGQHLQPVFYWHGEIDRVTEDAATSYVASLLQIQETLGEAPMDAVFVWHTKGGDMDARQNIQDAYGLLKEQGIKVWTVADEEALSAGSHLVAAGTPGCRFAMADARLGIHSLVAESHFQARALWRTEELAGRALAAGHSIDRRRAAFIQTVAGRFTSMDPNTIGSLVRANIHHAQDYASYSTALAPAAAFELMTMEKEMTYLTAREATGLGLLDGEQPPQWLQTLVQRAREEAHEVPPHVSKTNRIWEGRETR